jgi:hypothetical protein
VLTLGSSYKFKDLIKVYILCLCTGNLEQYEQAISKCEAQMERINERREKV